MVALKDPYPGMKSENDAAIIGVPGEIRFLPGPGVQTFDSAAAECLGVHYTIDCACGTDAPHSALPAC